MKITLPLQIADIDNTGKHIFCEVVINDKTGILIVDTGASQTVLSSKSDIVQSAISPIDYATFARMNSSQDLKEMFTTDELEQMGVSEDGVLSMAANGQAIDFQFGILDGLIIGELRVPPMPVGLIDISNISTLYQRLLNAEILGLLGSDLLLKYKAIIDYGKQTLTLKVSKRDVLGI